MLIVQPFDVADFLGRPGDTTVTDLARSHLPVVTAMVKAYVRGQGFDTNGLPTEELALVILSATARLVNNPEHTISETAGPFSTRQAVFDGWTLPELAVLHTYRRRTA